MKRGRPRTEPPEVRRRRILSAGRQVLKEKGYQEILLDDVARRAGIAKGTLYLYFKNKENLFAALFQDLVDDMESKLKKMGLEKLPAPAYLRHIVTEGLNFLDEHRDFIVQFSVKEPPFCGAETGHIMLKRFKEHIDFIAQIVKTGVREGSIKKCDIFTAALFLIALFRMFLMRKVLLGTSGPLKDSAGELMDLYLKGVGTK